MDYGVLKGLDATIKKGDVSFTKSSRGTKRHAGGVLELEMKEEPNYAI